MNFNSMRIITLSTVVILCPAAFAQAGEYGNVPPSMAQDNPAQQARPQRQGSQNQLPSMQEGGSNSGDSAQTIKDKMFLRESAEGGIAEVQFGQLAVQKAASEDVKTFGQKMIDDHTQLNKDMEPIADAMGVKLPTHMNKEDKAEYEKLNSLSGDDFDTEYLTLMVKDHHKDLRAFRLEAANTQDEDLRKAVTKGQRVIHNHLVTVDKLARNKGIAIPGRHGSKPPDAPQTQ